MEFWLGLAIGVAIIVGIWALVEFAVWLTGSE